MLSHDGPGHDKSAHSLRLNAALTIGQAMKPDAGDNGALQGVSLSVGEAVTETNGLWQHAVAYDFPDPCALEGIQDARRTILGEMRSKPPTGALPNVEDRAIARVDQHIDVRASKSDAISHGITAAP